MTDEHPEATPAVGRGGRTKIDVGGRTRLPPLHTIGVEPDPRFTLANERTFLAWNRTALALVGGGLAATQLLEPFDIPGGNKWLGVPLVIMGAALALISYFRWYGIERALREGRSIPVARVPAVLGVLIAVVAALAAGFILFS